MEQRSITSESEAAEAIAAIIEWLDTNPQNFDCEEKVRDWARDLLCGRVEDLGGCPLCQY